MSQAGGLRVENVRGIVFDLDGTLIDSYEAIADSLNTAMRGLGLPEYPPAEVRRMVGRGLETLIARALGVDESDAAGRAAVAEGVRLFRERYDEVCVAGTRLLPEVSDTLAALDARGYRMGVATNKPSYFARRLLSGLGAMPHLRVVMGPDLVAHHKPHPEMVHAALQRMGVAREHALYVGDMEIDVETARAAGLPVVVMPTGSCDATALAESGADVMLSGFGALLDLLPGPAL
ncbi:MAG: HAD family hydrolase [Candidatus Polarisedimenticolia bacterium]